MAIDKLAAEETDDETTAPETKEETTAESDADDVKDDEKGLSGGAIAGISVAAVAVIGLGGFSIYWFAIKKSTLAALLAIFKKK